MEGTLADGAIVQISGEGAATSIVYRASALGGCTKALLAARLEYDAMPTPAKVQKLYDDGHAAEQPAVDAIREKYRVDVKYRELKLRLGLTKRLAVVGHVDGLHLPPALSLHGPEAATGGVEIKSQSAAEWDATEQAGWPDAWPEYGLWERYKWQVSCYIAAGREMTGIADLPWHVYRYNRETGDVDCKVVDEAPYSVEEIRERVMKVEGMAMTGVMEEACDNRMWPCPYFYLHDDRDEGRELVDDEDVEALAYQYEKSRVEEKVAKDKKAMTRAALREMVVADRTVTNNGVKVTFFRKSKVVEMTVKPPPPVTEFGFVNEWEEVRVTLPKDGGPGRFVNEGTDGR